ncbi:hypothetical protein MRX96_032694 [Rhipicephalus microplus]
MHLKILHQPRNGLESRGSAGETQLLCLASAGLRVGHVERPRGRLCSLSFHEIVRSGSEGGGVVQGCGGPDAMIAAEDLNAAPYHMSRRTSGHYSVTRLGNAGYLRRTQGGAFSSGLHCDGLFRCGCTRKEYSNTKWKPFKSSRASVFFTVWIYDPNSRLALLWRLCFSAKLTVHTCRCGLRTRERLTNTC